MCHRRAAYHSREGPCCAYEGSNLRSFAEDIEEHSVLVKSKALVSDCLDSYFYLSTV